MARNDRFARILRILTVLATRRRGVAIKPLAAEHGWSWRTVYRDVQAIQAGGIPVEEVGEHRYRLADGWLPASAGLRPDEMLALFAAREAAAGWRATRLGKALDDLWLKLAVPTGQLPLPVDQPPWFSVRSPIGIDYRAHADAIAAIEQALERRRVLRATYRSLSRGELTTRDLEPCLLHWDPGLESLYLLAWCRLRRDVRVFAVHRFTSVAATQEPFTPRPGTSRAALDRAFRLWRGDSVERVRVRFSPAVAAEIRERRWHSSQRLADTADGGVILTLEVARAAELERWLLGYGPDAGVLEPESLRDRVQDRHAAAIRTTPAGSIPASRPALSIPDNQVADDRRRKIRIP